MLGPAVLHAKEPAQKTPRYTVKLLPTAFVCGQENGIKPPFLGFHGEVVGTAEIRLKPKSGVPEENGSCVRPIVWNRGRLKTYNTPVMSRRNREDREAYASAMDESGRIFGKVGSFDSGAISEEYYQAAVWPRYGAQTQRSPFVPGHSSAEFVAANRRGDAVGYALPGTPMEAAAIRNAKKDLLEAAEAELAVALFRDGQIGKTITLGMGSAKAINDRGEIAGNTHRKGLEHILFWDTDHKCRDFGMGCASSLNNRGVLVGSRDFANGVIPPDLHAYFWTRAGKAQQLPLLPKCVRSNAMSINDAGDIAGMAWPSDSQGGEDAAHACLWRDGNVYDLNTLAGCQPGCVLQQATSIDSAGHIVCVGRYHGQTRAFLLTPLPHS